jgi:M6 family metalloprotease-like protein
MAIFMSFFLIVSISTSKRMSFQKGTQDFGRYTYERTIERGGEVFSLYQSGEENFQYFHDENGFVLLVEDTGVYYAKTDMDGKLVSSQVSLNATTNEVASLEKITRYEIDFSKNSELIEELPFNSENSFSYDINELSSSATYDNPASVSNLVIFIAFSGETSLYDQLTQAADTVVATSLNGASGSLRDYFYTVTEGAISVSSHLPNAQRASSFVYRDSHNRGYYQVSGSTGTRTTREANLLVNAVNAAKVYFGDLSQYNLDSDNNGLIDAVSFILSGASHTEHGGLLWPHSWNLKSIAEYSEITPARIEGIEVEKYTFDFVSDFDYGVVTHEFGHVLGAPDYYHSNNDFVPVGEWDVMATQHRTPQYPLVYTRNKYFGGVQSNRIETISQSGVYSLKPTVQANTSDILAMKIPTQKTDEYFMVEYRNPSISPVYDSMLPGSGLIIYRINTKVTGNLNGVYQSSSKPDEVYVFRPSVSVEGSVYSRSRENLRFAALSPSNIYFKSVGKTTAASNFDPTTLYFTDGSNSGISIEALSMDGESIEFSIKLKASDTVDNMYFDNLISISDAKYVNDSYSGVASTVVFADNIILKDLAALTIALKDSTGAVLAENKMRLNRFTSAYNYGTREFISPFVVSAKGGIVNSIFSRGEFDSSKIPKTAVLYITDADKDVSFTMEINISNNDLTWAGIQATDIDVVPHIIAGSRITLGVRADGRAVVSRNMTSGQWDVSDLSYRIITLAAGLTHTLLLKESLEVYSVGSNLYGESDISSWTGIVLLSAGQYTSYGLRADGSVVAVGLNNFGQINVSSWSNVKTIAAGARHVVGVKQNGTVVAVGQSGAKLDVSSWSGIISVAAGNNFTAGLSSDGRVHVTGSLIGSEAVKGWVGVEKIVAGTDYLYALTIDGKVLSCGNNAYGQLYVDHLQDIIGIAAGERHGAFLREDGNVLFVGTGNSSYYTNSELPNLIYDNYINVSQISISLPSSEIELESVLQLNLLINPTNATYKRINYSSSNTDVAIVDENGRIFTTGVGSCIITARSAQSNAISTLSITVFKLTLPTGISFLDSIRSVKVNTSINLVYQFSPYDSNINPDFLTFSSSDSSLLTVSSNGSVIARQTAGNVTITVRYRDIAHSIDFSSSCQVQIILDIADIVWITQPTKKSYLFGESLDLSGGQIKIVPSLGDDIVENLLSLNGVTADGFNSINASNIGLEQSIIIRYMTLSLVYSVVVYDYVSNISISVAPKTQFVYGDEFSIGNGKALWTYASGKVAEKAFSNADVSGYNPTAVGRNILYLQLDKFKLSYEITVFDRVVGISNNIINKQYEFWSNFSYNDIVFAQMASGSVIDVPLIDTEVTGFDSKKIGMHQVTISYSDPITNTVHTDSVMITIKKPSFTLNLSGADENGYYRYLSNADIYMTVMLDIGKTSVEIENEPQNGLWYVLDGFDSSLSECTPIVRVNIASNAHTDGYEELGAVSINARSIVEFSGLIIGNKGTYRYGELIGIKLRITPLIGVFPSYEITPTASMIDYDPNKLGEPQEYKVTYLENIFTAWITIINYATSLIIPDEITVQLGENVEVSVFAQMAYGEEIDISQSISYIVDTFVVGVVEVPFTYNGTILGLDSDYYFVLRVIDSEVAISFTNTPSSVIYQLYSLALDLDLKFSLTLLSGATSQINYSPTLFSLTPQYNPYSLENQQIVLTYIPLSTSFAPIILCARNFVKSISIDSVSKTTYKYNEPISIYVTAIYANGITEALNPKRPNQSGYETNYNPRQTGNQTVVVSYIDPLRPDFLVNVELVVVVTNDASSITITTMPVKTVYYYGEALSFSQGVVEITFANGIKETYIDDNVLRNLEVAYSPLIPGQQTVILSKNGKETRYNVTISELKFEKDILSVDVNDRTILQNFSNLTIRFHPESTYQDLSAKLSTQSYFTIEIKDKRGNIIGKNAFNTKIRQGSIVQVNNMAGLKIREYTVWVFGDINDDGLLNSDDISILADQFLSGNSILELTDYDNNGKFSLTDIINWIKYINEWENSKLEKSLENVNANTDSQSTKRSLENLHKVEETLKTKKDDKKSYLIPDIFLNDASLGMIPMLNFSLLLFLTLGKRRKPSRHRLTKITCLILLISTMVGMVACRQKNEIARIDIADGVFKAKYDIDEELDLTNAKILVHYTSGDEEEFQINRSMISGFDTSTTGKGKQFTLTYKGFTVKISYDVEYFLTTVVDTPFRLNVTEVSRDSAIYLSLGVKNVEQIEGGVYAFSFKIEVLGLKILDINSSISQYFTMNYVHENSMVNVVMYSKDAKEKLTVDGEVMRIKVSKEAETKPFRIEVTNISMSNGEKDYINIPVSSLSLY